MCVTDTEKGRKMLICTDFNPDFQPYVAMAALHGRLHTQTQTNMIKKNKINVWNFFCKIPSISLRSTPRTSLSLAMSLYYHKQKLIMLG